MEALDRPTNPSEEVARALTIAAAKCIDAGLTDEQAGRGLLASLRSLRDRLRKARVN
jgi:hypothetical protein